MASVTAARKGDSARPEDDLSVALSAGRYDSFILRVYSRDHDGELVRGEVTHVPTRQKERFTEWRSALAFMIAQMARRSAGVDTCDDG